MKYWLFALSTLVTIGVWVELYATMTRQMEDELAVDVYSYATPEDAIFIPQYPVIEKGLSDQFWEWEAQGRLALIDHVLDDERIVKARKTWNTKEHDTESITAEAMHLITIQNASYDAEDHLQPPRVKFIALRGDANGLYVPEEETIFLNSKMQWNALPFERFVEVVLHENMHHIMTRMGTVLSASDILYNDFRLLERSAYHHIIGMAQDTQDVYQANPQELVAWRVQRAGRYAGIIGADLSVWEMTNRTQEIRGILNRAGY